MVSKISFALAMLAAVIVANSDRSHAAEVVRSDIPVAFGLLLDGKDAVYGQLVCHIHAPCQLIDNQDTRVQLSVTIESTQRLSGEVSIRCGELDCSFSSGSASAKLEGAAGGEKSRQFKLYAGKDAAITKDLVYRTGMGIGQILFLFGNQ